MKNYLSRRDKIKITAIEIIFQEGIQALSVNNIAKKEGIAPSLLYKYYRGMDELLQEMIIELGKFDARIYQSLQTSKLSADEKLKKFIETLGEYYQHYPEITPLLNSYEFFRSVPKLEEEIYSLLNKQTRYTREFIQEGVDQRKFSQTVDAGLYATILMGGVREEVFRWQVNVQKGGIQKSSLKDNLVKITKEIISTMEE